LIVEWLVYHRPTLTFLLKRLTRPARPPNPAKPTTSINRP
jgi:hypothetical protein